jgi:HD-GYP domain-containing protein (c-di-GMP phosphodiesterase class II)
MGGLFHDLGMKELERDLIHRPRYSWSREEVKVYESHPNRGLSILNEMQSVPEDVRAIVRQHHENCLARGYPSGMKKAMIHPMARLISVADEFCYRVIKSPHFREMTPDEALQDMMTSCAEQLDKAFLGALVELFRRASA